MTCLETSAKDIADYLARFCINSSAHVNQFGFKRSDLAAKLFQLFGMGSFINGTSPNNYGTSVSSTAFNQKYQVNLTVNLFPLVILPVFISILGKVVSLTITFLPKSITGRFLSAT